MQELSLNMNEIVGKNAFTMTSLRNYSIVAAVIWFILIALSLIWNVKTVRTGSIESARIEAHTAFERDVIYRRWNANYGGIYAPVTEKSRPNPYLDVLERDIATPSGKKLTKINPAYMTRQVHELGKDALGIEGHITSLNPIRPENTPDLWENQALKAFKTGAGEFFSVEKRQGEEYLRFMRPLFTEKGCLKCHAVQGYQVGDIRGGISISVPMAPFNAIAQKYIITLIIAHSCILLIGIAGLGFAVHHLHRQIEIRLKKEEALLQERDKLQKAIAEIKTLSGMLPICSSCKKIRDDKGYWNQIESYICDHSEAEFSHGICPDCFKKMYPSLDT